MYSICCFLIMIYTHTCIHTYMYVHINAHVTINEKVYQFKENREGYMGELKRGKERQNVIIKIKFQ